MGMFDICYWVVQTIGVLFAFKLLRMTNMHFFVGKSISKKKILRLLSWLNLLTNTRRFNPYNIMIISWLRSDFINLRVLREYYFL